MDRKEILYIIRCSDGTMRCVYGTYEAAVEMAEEYVRGTGLTHVIS